MLFGILLISFCFGPWFVKCCFINLNLFLLSSFARSLCFFFFLLFKNFLPVLVAVWCYFNNFSIAFPILSILACLSFYFKQFCFKCHHMSALILSQIIVGSYLLFIFTTLNAFFNFFNNFLRIPVFTVCFLSLIRYFRCRQCFSFSANVLLLLHASLLQHKGPNYLLGIFVCLAEPWPLYIKCNRFSGVLKNGCMQKLEDSGPWTVRNKALWSYIYAISLFFHHRMCFISVNQKIRSWGEPH